MHTSELFRRRWAATITGMVATMVVTAGCGGPERDDQDPLELPDGSEEVVIQFHTRGTGPPAPQTLQLRFSSVPEVTAYGDGRVVVAGQRTGQVRKLQVATLSRQELTDLVAGARDDGLLVDGGPDTGDTAFSHPAVTRVTIAEVTTTHELTVADLGQEDLIDLSSEQRRTRRAVDTLRTRLRSRAEESARPYPPGGLAVSVLPGSFEPEGTEPTAWPLERPLAEGGEEVATGEGWRCLHVTGDDAVAAVTAAARGADGSTWSSGGQEWTLAVRPLLPHEQSCP